MTDPRLIDAVSFAESVLDIHPDPVQTQILMSDAWRGLINCSRQWGKSTVIAVKALWHALRYEKSTILVLCPTSHQAGEFFENLRSFIAQSGYPARGDGHNKIAVRLPNGSRIIGLSGRSRIRSYRKVSLMLVDEAAEVPESAYYTLRPTLATTGEFGGKIWMMSTPQGRQGMFWHAWEHEGDRWTRFSVPATECPRISRKFLEEERLILGARMFAQEYLCQFNDPPGCMLNREDVWRALRSDVPAVWQ